MEITKYDTTSANIRLRSRLENIIRENPKAIVKIGDNYEISRPVALALISEINSFAVSNGLSFSFTSDIVHLDIQNQIAIVKVKLIVKDNQKEVISIESLGSCSITENKRTIHEVIATAETRALKRAMETFVGEDFINQIILTVKPQQVKISQAQKNYILDLLNQRNKKLSDYTTKSIDELTYNEAREIISKLKGE